MPSRALAVLTMDSSMVAVRDAIQFNVSIELCLPMHTKAAS